MLSLPATPSPLATAAFVAPPAASATPPTTPLIAEVSEVLTGQYYLTVIVECSHSIELVACVFFYRLCIITIIVSFYLAATPAATPASFYGRVPPPAQPGK